MMFVFFLLIVCLYVFSQYCKAYVGNDEKLKIQILICRLNENSNCTISTEHVNAITLGYFHFLSPHNNNEVLFNIIVFCW